MTEFLPALAWAAAIVFGMPAAVYVALLVRSWLRPTWDFVVFYGLFQVAWFLLATPLVALTWPLPPPARAAVATTLVHLAARAFPPTSTMARFPLYALRLRRLPVVATSFAAGYTYQTPDQPDYAVTPFDDHLFPSPDAATTAGFHPRRD